MPGRSHSGSLPPLSQNEIEIQKQIKKHVVALSEKIGERNLYDHKALESAAEYIEKTFASLGYKPSIQNFKAKNENIKNIEIELAGSSMPHEIIIVGAHYDSVFGSPGANDNATGIAAVLETAGIFARQKFKRTIRLVAFVNEEPPFFMKKSMGSRVYAKRSRKRGEKIIGMLSIETIGYYSDKEKSQKYPPPFNLLYPSKGNFIAFVGNTSSRNLVHKCIASFRRHTKFPSEGIAAPGLIPGISWSDHWAFWKEGYPALMITDTAPFRYPYYHTAEDTPDKIDYAKTARIVAGLARVVAELANGKN
jgi:Zn-dependent M28 family amino/carboxypeptidase